MDNLEKIDNKQLGERLKETRKSLKRTQMDVSSDLNIPQPNISTYEKGVFAPPLSFLMAFAQKYDVSVDYLLGLSKWPKQADIRDLMAEGSAICKENEDKQKIIEISVDTLDDEVKKNIEQ